MPPLPRTHSCSEDDHAARIAERYQEIEWSMILQAVKTLGRKNPYLLCPGDILTLPHEEPKIENESTGKEHSHTLNRSPLVLKLRLLDDNHEPYRDCPYTLKIDVEPDVRQGNKPDGSPRKTNALGMIEEPEIPPKAKEAKLTVTVAVPVPQEPGSEQSSTPDEPPGASQDDSSAPDAPPPSDPDPSEEPCITDESPESEPSDETAEDVQKNGPAVPQNCAPVGPTCTATLTWTLHIGRLNPILDDESTMTPANIVVAAQQRLRNLGYFVGDCDGKTSDLLHAAINAFRVDYCGEDPKIMDKKRPIDETLKRRLAEVHDQAGTA